MAVNTEPLSAQKVNAVACHLGGAPFENLIIRVSYQYCSIKN